MKVDSDCLLMMFALSDTLRTSSFWKGGKKGGGGGYLALESHLICPPIISCMKTKVNLV